MFIPLVIRSTEGLQSSITFLHPTTPSMLTSNNIGSRAAGSGADGDRGAGFSAPSSHGDGRSVAFEEEANRTISMLAGTAELLKFSRLLLLLSEAISVSASVQPGGSGPGSRDRAPSAGAAGGGAGGAAAVVASPAVGKKTGSAALSTPLRPHRRAIDVTPA